MKYFLLCSLFFISNLLTAQYGLDGFWKGEIITKDGIHRIEVTLDVDNYSWRSKGQTVVYLKDRKIVKRLFTGKLYSDRSLWLEEIVEEKDGTSFSRKYQLLLDRSSSGAILKGFWQEIVTDPFAKTRQKGILTLVKQKKGV